jgi:hypothetical protein
MVVDYNWMVLCWKNSGVNINEFWDEEFDYELNNGMKRWSIPTRGHGYRRVGYIVARETVRRGEKVSQFLPEPQACEDANMGDLVLVMSHGGPEGLFGKLSNVRKI